MNRRHILKVTAAATGGLLVPQFLSGQASTAKEGTVRDRFWLFACPTNTDFPHLQRRSVMSPAEGAYYMGIPNLIIVNTGGEEAKYGRFEPPLEQYAMALRPFRRIGWSIVSSAGATAVEERRLGIELAKKTANFVAIFMDDFFGGMRRGQQASLSLEELRAIQSQLKAGEKKLDLLVTLYTKELDLPVGDYLKLIDVATLWTSNPEELVNLESNMQKLEKVAPKIRKMLGCYWIDYNTKGGVPVSSMELQCETGLRWLRQGRIEGMIFLGNTNEDLGFESVEWTRRWIQKVGDRKL